MKKSVIPLLLLLISASGLQAQDVKITSAPGKSAILLGDQIFFTITTEVSAGVHATISSAVDTLTAKVVILDRVPRDTTASDSGVVIYRDSYLITSFDSGTYTLPPFYAEVATADTVLRYYSEPASLQVLRADVAPQDSTEVIFDIVPPRTAPLTFSELLPWIIIIVIFSVVIWLLARYLPNNPLRRFVRPAPPPEPAHVIALRDLERLRSAELWQKGEIKKYYSALSDIMRRYLDNRYGIGAPEMTSDETIRMMHRAAVTTESQRTMVKELLSLSDMVKFAKYYPGSDLHASFFDDVVKFVNETREPDSPSGETTDEGKNSGRDGSMMLRGNKRGGSHA